MSILNLQLLLLLLNEHGRSHILLAVKADHFIRMPFLYLFLFTSSFCCNLKQLDLNESDDVIIFEKKHCDDNYELATCEDYFKDLLYRVEIVFIDKTNPSDAGFTLELSQRMSYEQMANAVGQKMNVDPNTIQFFRCQK